MKHTLMLCLFAGTMSATPAWAHDSENTNQTGLTLENAHGRKSLHAPIGVMGDHMHHQGEWMLSYRYMRMEMDGMRDGTHDLSPEDIAGNASLYPNPNGPPAGFRVIPDKMSMDMHMLGGMYGLTDNVTLMAMANYLENDMSLITFSGMMGTTRLGKFKTKSSGWGDTKLGAMFRLYDDDINHVQLNAMLSIPTGSIKEKDDVLTPMNTRMTMRLPYAMQLGSGTYDAEPALTYTGATQDWNWGAQYAATLRLENENAQGYSLGNRHKLTAWGGYQFTDWLRGTLRVTGESIGDIDGADPMITAPVTTADPDNYGGKFVETGLGFNITPPALKGAQMAAEFTAPVYQNLNGPQMKRDYGFTIGLQYSF